MDLDRLQGVKRIDPVGAWLGSSRRACVQKGVGEWCPRPFFCSYGSLGFLYDSWDIGYDLYYSLYMGLRWRWTVLYPLLFRLS